ncbi:MAG: carbonate dehydratase [Cyclobacteriaceae bacterium]
MNDANAYNKLLEKNLEWVNRKNKEDKDFFSRLSRIQTPQFLWIGCSDSRVPANEITDTDPGEIFVHRNIANMVIHTDMNLLSVLDYAVNVLEVNHVIVCGHYGCGGVKAAMGNKQYGVIDNWIRHIKDVYVMYHDELEAIQDPEAREHAFTEYNVMEQVYDLSQTSIIQNSWARRHKPSIHGWVYDIRNGVIKDLNVTMNDHDDLPSIFKLKPH